MSNLKFESEQNDLPYKTASFIEILATSLGVEPENFRLITEAFAINDEKTLFDFFDIIPSESPNIHYSKVQNQKISEIYQKILDANADEKRTYKYAHINYHNQEHWLSTESEKTPEVGKHPKFSPSMSEVESNLNEGAAVHIHYHSNNNNTVLPDAKKIEFDSSFFLFGESKNKRNKNINEMASSHPIAVDIKIDQYANLPVQFGSWFTSGLLIKAYSNQDKWQSETENVSWEKMFGEKGIFKHVITSALFAKGIKIKIQSFGTYSPEGLEYLKQQTDLKIWPFYIPGTEFTLNSDKSITIDVSYPQNKFHLLGFSVDLLSNLFS